MSKLIFGAVLLCSLALVAAQSRPAGQAGAEGRRQSSRERPSPQGESDRNVPVDGDALIRRGDYLVNSVAMCVQCHTPRNEQGELIHLQLLTGAQVPVRSPWPTQQWAYRAPSLAGLPGGWSEENVIKLLMTGTDPQGRTPNPPMPPFRMSREDARAVAAYLKAVKPGGAMSRGGSEKP